MKIQLQSDIHLEHANHTVAETAADVLILSGDILVANYFQRGEASPYYVKAQQFKGFLFDCGMKFDHVIYIMGNHEHYHGRFFDTASILRQIVHDINLSIPGKIHFLDKEYIDIDDTRFFGATLWTDALKADPICEFHLERSMNDYHIIQYAKDGMYRKLRVMDTFREHKETLKALDASLDHDKIVVCTHHTPSFLSVDERYKNDHYLNGGYHSDLYDYITERPQIKLWTSGHTHSSYDYMIDNTRLLCNPRGYNDENPNFNNSLVVEV